MSLPAGVGKPSSVYSHTPSNTYGHGHSKLDEDNFDAYNDFNNLSPRQYDGATTAETASMLPPAFETKGHDYGNASSIRSSGRVEPELIKMPIRGPEWQDEELHAMTKSHAAEEREYKWGGRGRSWWRGQAGGKYGRRGVVLWAFGIFLVMSV